MRRALVMLPLLVMTGCGGSGREIVCREGEGCCSGSVLERCQEHVWMAEVDCAASGKTCREDQQAKAAACESQPKCDEGRLRCEGDMLRLCSQGTWVDEEDCAASLGWCADGVPDAACARLGWRHLEIEIDDPVIQGSSLFLPIDGPSFGYSA